jgi:hypothetical protein
MDRESNYKKNAQRIIEIRYYGQKNGRVHFCPSLENFKFFFSFEPMRKVKVSLLSDRLNKGHLKIRN